MHKFREFTILLLILGGTKAENSQLFDDVGWINKWIFPGALDNTTESGFTVEVEESILVIRSQVCMQDGECSGLLGCNCDKQFEKLGRNFGTQCTDLPCRVMDYILKNGARALRDLREVSSFSTYMRWLTGHFFPPFQEYVCQCNPNLFEAVAHCALGYDGEFVGQEIQEQVRNFAQKLGKKNLKRAPLLISNMLCVDNGRCLEELAQTLINLASMLDNAIDSEMNECYHFGRLGEKIDKYEWKWMRRYGIFDGMLTMFHELAKEFWCGKVRCVEYLDSTFNTCCGAKRSSTMRVKELGSLLKAIESIAYETSDDFSIGEFGTASRKLKKNFLQIWKPEELCQGLYEKKTCE